GKRVRCESVQALQCALRLLAAVSLAHGRSAGGLPDLREGSTARCEPDWRAQRGAAWSPAHRTYSCMGYGWRRRELPRHQLCDLPGVRDKSFTVTSTIGTL